MLSLEEFKCFLNYLWCCTADGTTALAREYREMPEAPQFAFDRVQAEKSMITPFLVPSAPMPLPRSLRPRRLKSPGSRVPLDPECCYLYVDGSYEPTAENSPEKCGWRLHVVRANVVQGQFGSPIFSGLLRESTRVFKLSNNLVELVALVHALEFVLSQPSSLNFMICSDSMHAHVVQQSWQAKSHLEVVRFVGELHGRCDLHAKVRWHWVRGHSRDLVNDAADALAKAGARGQWHLW